MTVVDRRPIWMATGVASWNSHELDIATYHPYDVYVTGDGDEYWMPTPASPAWLPYRDLPQSVEFILPRGATLVTRQSLSRAREARSVGGYHNQREPHDSAEAELIRAVRAILQAAIRS